MNAISASGATGTFSVPFVTNGETRQARVTMNGNECTFEHQYKATYTLPGAAGASPTSHEVFYYQNDGIELNLPVLDASSYAEPDGDGIEYHANSWSVQGQTVSGGTVIINATDDVALGDITQTVDRSYGFRASDNTLVVNQTSGTLHIENSGGRNFEKIELPASAANGSISLDLSGVSGFTIAGDPGAGEGQGQPAITNGSKLGSVTLPDTDFQLGFGAFMDCSNLTSIDLSKCTSIDIWAFKGCTGLNSVDLSHCNTIRQYAFEDCTGLNTSINISNCTNLEKGAFKGCSGITGVTLSNDPGFTTIPEYTFNGCISLGPVTLPDNITTIEQYAFINCSSLSSVSVTDNSLLSSIGQQAFYNSGLVSITIPAGVTTMGNSAFESCSALSSVTVKQGCSIIGNDAFKNCTSLHELDLPANVYNICNRIIDGCSNMILTLRTFPTNSGTARFAGTSGDFTMIFKPPAGQQMIIENVMNDGSGNFFHNEYPDGNFIVVFDITDGGTIRIEDNTFSVSGFPTGATFKFINGQINEPQYYMYMGTACFIDNALAEWSDDNGLNFISLHWDASNCQWF